jgi:hypothetical protein
MEGNPGKRLTAPRRCMFAVEAQRCVGFCQRGVARGAYTRSDAQGAFLTPLGFQTSQFHPLADSPTCSAGAAVLAKRRPRVNRPSRIGLSGSTC